MTEDARRGGPALSPPALGPGSQGSSLVIVTCGKPGSEGSAGACEAGTVLALWPPWSKAGRMPARGLPSPR